MLLAVLLGGTHDFEKAEDLTGALKRCGVVLVEHAAGGSRCLPLKRCGAVLVHDGANLVNLRFIWSLVCFCPRLLFMEAPDAETE